MTLSTALKMKNRLAGELVRQQQILQRENARRSDSVSQVDRGAVYQKILDLSEQLGEIKGKITQANIGIYPALERMAEYKAHISFLQGLVKRDGEEITSVGHNQEKLTYMWDSFIPQENCDLRVAELQLKIHAAQDFIDEYNGKTQLP